MLSKMQILSHHEMLPPCTEQLCLEIILYNNSRDAWISKSWPLSGSIPEGIRSRSDLMPGDTVAVHVCPVMNGPGSIKQIFVRWTWFSIKEIDGFWKSSDQIRINQVSSVQIRQINVDSILAQPQFCGVRIWLISAHDANAAASHLSPVTSTWDYVFFGRCACCPETANIPKDLYAQIALDPAECMSGRTEIRCGMGARSSRHSLDDRSSVVIGRGTGVGDWPRDGWSGAGSRPRGSIRVTLLQIVDFSYRLSDSL